MKESELKPRIYTIATAHLDTSWHWTLEDTARTYLPDTCEKNFALLEKYPDYVFNFEGAYRYELIQEYYPGYFEKIREYARAGRWYPAGSAYENGDTNIPSPEALIRNIQYGSDFFKKEFGTEQHELFLPDCFGFSSVIPAVARHAGLYGFSTQKLPMAGIKSIPFDIGRWYAPDGSFIFASLDNMNYGFSFKRGVRTYHHAKAKLRENTHRFSVPFAALYHGTGDRGGAPKEQSVETVCREVKKNGVSKTDVLSASADRIFTDLESLPKELRDILPVYHGELIAADHGTGCYTARSCGKRMNRKAEQLLFSAELLSSAARLTGKLPYPADTYNRLWKSLISHQFHDDITGTGAMECSERAWNDYALIHAAAAEEIYASSAALGDTLDTSFCRGTPLAVVSAAGTAGRRRGSVKVHIDGVEGKPPFAVFNCKGAPVPCGAQFTPDGYCILSFTADTPASGIAVYDLVPNENGDFECLTATQHRLENDRLRVLIDGSGDICSIYLKSSGRELLSAPIRYNLLDFNGVSSYPAWELNYRETVHAPAGYPIAPEITVTECSPARAAIKVTRSYKGSRFTESISLSRRSDRCDVSCEVDWRSFRSLLKVRFPLTAANDNAAYDTGLGYITRRNGDKTLYEFPAQNWADISARNGSFGVSVLSDSRTGWDKPDDGTLRLTAVFSPKASRGENCSQQLLDFGINRFSYSVFPHAGSDLTATQREGAFFNSPLYAFTLNKHTGSTREMTLCSVSHPNVMLRSFKKALNSDAAAVRVNEGAGKEVRGVTLSLPDGVSISRAYEADGRENILSEAHISDGKLVFDMTPFSVKTFLIYTDCADTAEQAVTLKLPFNACASSEDGDRAEGIFPDSLSIPKKLIPSKICCGGVSFAPDMGGHCVRAAGQSIPLPDGTKSVYLLAGSISSDREAEFTAGGVKTRVTVPDMLENFGTWDLLALNRTGYIKRGAPAFVFTHMHSPEGDVHCKLCTLFSIRLNAGSGGKLMLPEDENILVFAVSASEKELSCKSAVRLTEELEKRECDFVYTDDERKKSIPSSREKRRARYQSNMRYVRVRLKRELDSFR